MFVSADSSGGATGHKKIQGGGAFMPHQTDVTERLGNRPGGATPEDRGCIHALYDGGTGRQNDVGRAFAAVCQGCVPQDEPALLCLRGMGLTDDNVRLTDRGQRVRDLVIG